MREAKSRPQKSRDHGESGQVIIMVAFAAIALFAIIGLAIDAGRLYVTRAELSRSVDAAALSGILEFNGTVAGLNNGEAKAEAYFYENEGAENTTLDIQPDGDKNEMTVDATKTVDLFFMSVLGIDSATVSAHAKAGFGVNYLDAVMVLDATPSMAGNPIEQASLAADQFKDIMLGSNPEGNVSVGVTAFRGCFRPSPISHSECVLTTGSNRWVQALTSTHSVLDTVLENIEDASGGASVGTNVCTGLAMGWNLVSDAALNHSNDLLYPDNQQFIILLSDGDNYYSGNNTYQDPYYTSGAYNSSSSPTGTTVAGTVYSCQPIDSGSTGSPCGSPWNDPAITSSNPCYTGKFQPKTEIALDEFDGPSNSCPSTWTSGTGSGTGVWSGPWVTSSSNVSAQGNDTSANDTRCHIRIGGSGWICRSVDLSTVAGATLYSSLKRNDWSSSSDDFHLQVSTDSNACSTGSGFTTVSDMDRNDLGTGHQDYTFNLDSYGGQTIYIRFQGSTNSNSEYVWVDTVQVQGGSIGDQDGYLNGIDGSQPANCATDQTPRERQLDVRTLQLANAIKAAGIEIYVVAFAGQPGVVQNCSLGQDVSMDQSDPTDCGLVTTNSAYPIGKGGKDGFVDSTVINPNVRLLQCIASPGTDDHYFYAATAEDLPSIFTQIATQISHRLIE